MGARTKSKDDRRPTMAQEMRTADATWLALRQAANFQPFFDGLLEYLKQNLEKCKIGGSYEYYTCGHDHQRWDRQWEPFKHLQRYCPKTVYSFYQAKDLIEDHIERKVICECRILTDEKDLGRMRLQTAFGVDFGEPGRRELDVV